MNIAKTIDELYLEANGYDIVISNDAALVSALNSRIDTARVGRLASTPMMIAKDHEDAVLEKLMASGKCVRDGKFGIMKEVELLERISETTGYDIRFVHGEVENIRMIRRYTESVEKYLTGRPSREIYKAFSELPTYEMVMGAFDPSVYHAYDGKRVAVIGLDLFDDLDKHFVLPSVDEIDLFKEGEYHIDTIYAVGNDKQAAEHAVDLVNADNAEDTAIVMDTSGPIADAVRSALYRKGIAFKNVLSAKDLTDVRDYMEFVTKALSYEILTVNDVRELFACYGGRESNRCDEYLLNRYSGGKRFGELSELMKNIREYTFSELCDELLTGLRKGMVKTVLGELNAADVRISDKSAGSVSYLIGSMEGIKHNAEIPDSEKRGVLLADCRNSVFIDRPFVIYLNLDSGWSGQTAGKDYIDREAEEEKDLRRFQVLLQQGSSRIFIVNTMKDGKEARPCTLFSRLNKNADGSPRWAGSFGDLTGTVVKRGTWLVPEEHEEKEHAAGAAEEYTDDISATEMSAYVACPRGYMFSKLVRTPDTESTVFGTMMHEFAEFCLCYLDSAKKKMDECTGIIIERCAGISCPEKRELDRSKIGAEMMNMLRFIDSLDLRPPLNTDIGGRKRKNKFFEHFSLTDTADIAEVHKRSAECRLHGYFDLLTDGRIIDFKTGTPLTTSKILSKMDVTRKNDYYDVQALVYLAILDEISGADREKEFMLFYAADNDTEAFDPGFDVMRNTRSVVLLDIRKEEMIRNGTILRLVTASKDREFIRTEIGKGFNDALLRAGVENAGNWKDDGELFEKIFSLQKKNTKGAMDAVAYAIKKAGELMSQCFITDGARILIPRDSMEKFKKYSKEIRRRISEERMNGFPAEPRGTCDRCRYFDICTGGMINDAESGSEEDS